MNILEFIETQYPIKQKVQAKFQDPYKRIQESDSLPYDLIGPDESGAITKLVEVEEGRNVSVFTLLSMSDTDAELKVDLPLANAYKSYMSLIDIDDLNLIDIMESVKAYQDIINKRSSALNVLSL